MNNDIKFYKGDIASDVKVGKTIAIDCEMMGLNVTRDRLCLVQISTGNSDAHVIQLDSNFNAPNLVNLLSDKSISKIFHFARADLAHIKWYLKVDVENVECTKIQSKICRTFTESHSLKTLIKEFIGIDVSKALGQSDWGGELTSKQLQYCANDVLFLHKIHEELNKMLEREKRMNLYKDCIKFLKTRVEADIAGFKDIDLWSH
jgi:ribonuclease D